MKQNIFSQWVNGVTVSLQQNIPGNHYIAFAFLNKQISEAGGKIMVVRSMFQVIIFENPAATNCTHICIAVSTPKHFLLKRARYLQYIYAVKART